MTARRARVGATTLAALGLSLCAVAPLVAQRPAPAAGGTVVGRLVEEGGGAPVSGAFVALLDSTDARVAGALSHADGRFVVAAPRPGTFRLIAERIGFAGVTSVSFVLEAGDVRRMDLTAPTRAIELAGVEVAGGRRCDLGPAAGQATLAVWEEARKALTVADWTDEAGQLAYAIRTWTRRLTPDGRRVVSERSQRETHLGRTAFRAEDAESLARDGFVQGEGEDRIFYAPDASVLLSDAFLDTHCFERVADEGRVGLRFGPVPGRDLPEVEGTLWLDASSGELRDLDYRFVNLAGVSSPRAGGEVEFERLDDGAWIVRRWTLRMPVVGIRVDERGDELSRELSGLEEVGGEVLEVLSGGRSRGLEAAADGAVAGVALDSAGAEPLVGASVYLSGTSHEAVAGAGGAFLLEGVRPGTYRLVAEHPSVRARGLPPLTADVTVEAGRTAVTEVGVPAAETVLERHCLADDPAPAQPGSLGLVPADVGGVVLDATGRPVADVRIRVWWRWVESIAGAHEQRSAGIEVTPDGLGAWFACGLPSDRAVGLEIVRPGAEPEHVELGVLGEGEIRWVVVAGGGA